MNEQLYQWADLNESRTRPTTPATPVRTSSSATIGGWTDEPGGGDSASAQGGVAGSGTPSAGSLSNVGSALGVAGALTGTPELGMAGSALNTGLATAAGQYGPIGSLVGGLATRSPYGALAGGLVGRAVSDAPISGKTIGNTLLGIAVPGYGLVNAFTGGLLGNAAFGKDASFDVSTGAINQRTPGLFGTWGLESPPSTLEAATAQAAMESDDPLGAFAGSMASQQDVRDQQRAQESFRTSEIGFANEFGGWASSSGEDASSADAVSGHDAMSDSFGGGVGGFGGGPDTGVTGSAEGGDLGGPGGGAEGGGFGGGDVGGAGDSGTDGGDGGGW